MENIQITFPDGKAKEHPRGVTALEVAQTRPMVCFVNVQSVDRIIYAIFNGYNERRESRNRTLRIFTQAA